MISEASEKTHHLVFQGTLFTVDYEYFPMTDDIEIWGIAVHADKYKSNLFQFFKSETIKEMERITIKQLRGY